MATTTGRCYYCGHPFDDHTLPPLGKALVPFCQPPKGKKVDLKDLPNV